MITVFENPSFQRHNANDLYLPTVCSSRQGPESSKFSTIKLTLKSQKVAFLGWMASSLARNISSVYFTYNTVVLVSHLQYCEEGIWIVLFSDMNPTQLKILLPQLPMGITPRVLCLLDKCSTAELASALRIAFDGVLKGGQRLTVLSSRTLIWLCQWRHWEMLKSPFKKKYVGGARMYTHMWRPESTLGVISLELPAFFFS